MTAVTVLSACWHMPLNSRRGCHWFSAAIHSLHPRRLFPPRVLPRAWGFPPKAASARLALVLAWLPVFRKMLNFLWLGITEFCFSFSNLNVSAAAEQLELQLLEWLVSYNTVPDEFRVSNSFKFKCKGRLSQSVWPKPPRKNTKKFSYFFGYFATTKFLFPKTRQNFPTVFLTG